MGASLIDLSQDEISIIWEFCDPFDWKHSLLSKKWKWTFQPLKYEQVLSSPQTVDFKTLIRLFQTQHVVIEPMNYNENARQNFDEPFYANPWKRGIIKRCKFSFIMLEEMLKLVQLSSKMWNCKYQKNENHSKWTNHQIDKIGSICKQNSSFVHVFEFKYLNGIDLFPQFLLEYEPFFGEIPYPFQFKIHMDSFDHQFLNKIPKTHPAFEFVFNTSTQSALMCLSKLPQNSLMCFTLNQLEHQIWYMKNFGINEKDYKHSHQIKHFIEQSHHQVNRLVLKFNYFAIFCRNTKIYLFVNYLLIHKLVKEIFFNIQSINNHSIVLELIALCNEYKIEPLVYISPDLIKICTPFFNSCKGVHWIQRDGDQQFVLPEWNHLKSIELNFEKKPSIPQLMYDLEKSLGKDWKSKWECEPFKKSYHKVFLFKRD